MVVGVGGALRAQNRNPNLKSQKSNTNATQYIKYNNMKSLHHAPSKIKKPTMMMVIARHDR